MFLNIQIEQDRKKRKDIIGIKNCAHFVASSPFTREWVQLFLIYKWSLCIALCLFPGHSFSNICSTCHRHLRYLLRGIPFHKAFPDGTFKYQIPVPQPTLPVLFPAVVSFYGNYHHVTFYKSYLFVVVTSTRTSVPWKQGFGKLGSLLFCSVTPPSKSGTGREGV